VSRTFITQETGNDTEAVNTPLRKTLPKPTQVILEVNNVQEAISESSVCKNCRRKALEFRTKNVGVATTPSIVCTHCGRDTHSSPAKTGIGPSYENRRCLTDYAVNVLYVLGFLTVGDGSCEAQRILDLLDLPSPTTMERTSFPRIEKEISPFIIGIGEDTMKNNLIDEVAQSLDSQVNVGRMCHTVGASVLPF
jgi:hypothetical protein